MTTEHRVVCDRFGTRGHSDHKWIKTGKNAKKRATQIVIDQNHHAEMHPDHFYAKEAPYRRQEREVTEWEDSE